MAQPPVAQQQCPTCAGPVAPGRMQCEFCGTPITPYGGAAFGGGGGAPPQPYGGPQQYGGGPPVAPFGGIGPPVNYNPYPQSRSSPALGIGIAVAVVILFMTFGTIMSFTMRARRRAAYVPSYTVDTVNVPPTPTVVPIPQPLGPNGGSAGNTSLALFEPKCASGDTQSCVVLGMMYRNGQTVPVDEAKARTYFARACSLGDKSGCTLRDMKPVHH